eukprot:CAMPEP_0184488388 /NCGR_PEP_ID=MMETSP0113_2-20130426/11687_1 /TAXON_ID=91329 /ORGANISM="Norrisiella sphaerica, Strain BC52" /LENGTH=46 /DNA_ID= /DNA_START= /DNA_END= /DNA_ORIENTATION=
MEQMGNGSIVYVLALERGLDLVIKPGFQLEVEIQRLEASGLEMWRG